MNRTPFPGLINKSPRNGVPELTKHSKELRFAAAGMAAAGWGRERIADSLGVPRSTMRKWLRTNRSVGREGLLAMGSRRKSYSWEDKVAAARAVCEQGVPKPEAMARFGVAGESTLDAWCRRYREGGPEALAPRPKGRPAGRPPATREQELEREVERLEAQVAYLKKSIALKAELGLLPGRGPRP